MDSNISYFIGFLFADGNLYECDRNRGKIRIEINSKDKDILYDFAKLFNLNYIIRARNRTTNFKNIATHTLIIYDFNFRCELKHCGMIAGKKSDIVSVPKVPYSDKDFWRGFIDGDGSLGFTKTGKPFISLITKSESLKNEYLNFIFKYINKNKTINRNKRDNAYNIMLMNEDAQDIAKLLYYDGCISLNRKKQISVKVTNWVRNYACKKRLIDYRKWCKYEDTYVLSHSLEESSAHLKRSFKSVSIRLFRLKSGKVKVYKDINGSTSVVQSTLDEAPDAYKDASVIEKAIEPTATIIDRIKPLLNLKDCGVK